MTRDQPQDNENEYCLYIVEHLLCGGRKYEILETTNRRETVLQNTTRQSRRLCCARQQKGDKNRTR